MKRPLVVIGFTYLLTAALCAYLPMNVCLAAGICLGLFALLAIISQHSLGRVVATVLFVASIACVAVMLQSLWRVQPTRSLAGQQLELSGTVSKVSSARSIELTTGQSVVALTARETLDVEVGDSFSAVLALSSYEAESSSLFARRKAKTVPLRGFVLGDYQSTSPAADTLLGKLGAVKRLLSNNLRQLLPGDEGKVLCSLLLGESYRVPQEVSKAYAAAGTSHILSVSGYHIAVIAGFVALLLRRLHLHYRLSSLCIILFLLAYLVLVGFTPSATRAVVMAVLHQLALLVGRKGDSLTALAVAGLVLCGLSPLTASDVGFQLSFMATLGILLLSPRLNTALGARLGTARFEKAREFFVSALSVTLCATLFTLPVIVLSFEQLALYAPLTNLLVAPLMPLLLGSGLLAMVLSLLPTTAFAMPFVFVAGTSVTVLTSVSTMISRLPFATLPVGADFMLLWMPCTAALIGLSFVRPSRKKFTACGALCTITLLVGAFSYQLALRGAVLTTILPTDNGIVLIAVKDRHAVVVGSVNSKSDVYMVDLVLRSHIVTRVDLFALAPTDGRRGGAVCALFEDYNIAVSVLGAQDYADERIRHAARDVGEVYPWGTMTVRLLDYDSVQIYQNEVCVDISGIKTFLLTGECAILDCMKQLGNADVAVLAGGAPSDLALLRCGLLVTNGVFGTQLPVPTTVLGTVPSAAYLAKDGRFRAS